MFSGIIFFFILLNKFNIQNINYNFFTNKKLYKKYNILNNNNEINPTYYNLNILKNKLNYDNINFLNEIQYLTNKKTKVYINISKIIPYTNIYHIGIIFKRINQKNKYEIYNDKGLFILDYIPRSTLYKEIFWGYSDKTLLEIEENEKSLNITYILGLYDCRHYSRDLSNWTTKNPTPVWKLKDIINNNNNI